MLRGGVLAIGRVGGFLGALLVMLSFRLVGWEKVTRCLVVYMDLRDGNRPISGASGASQ